MSSSSLPYRCRIVLPKAKGNKVIKDKKSNNLDSDPNINNKLDYIFDCPLVPFRGTTISPCGAHCSYSTINTLGLTKRHTIFSTPSGEEQQASIKVLTTPDGLDIIQEAILAYRCIIQYKTYQVETGLDKIFLYALFCIQECIETINQSINNSGTTGPGGSNGYIHKYGRVLLFKKMSNPKAPSLNIAQNYFNLSQMFLSESEQYTDINMVQSESESEPNNNNVNYESGVEIRSLNAYFREMRIEIAKRLADEEFWYVENRYRREQGPETVEMGTPFDRIVKMYNENNKKNDNKNDKKDEHNLNLNDNQGIQGSEKNPFHIVERDDITGEYRCLNKWWFMFRGRKLLGTTMWAKGWG